MYKSLAASHGSPVADALQKEINRFRRWTGPKKFPD
jgi:hypothetical protein